MCGSFDNFLCVFFVHSRQMVGKKPTTYQFYKDMCVQLETKSLCVSKNL